MQQLAQRLNSLAFPHDKFHVNTASTHEAQPVTTQDRQHMQHALSVAKQGLGKTYPNPAVGCVIVKQGKVAAEHSAAHG